MIYKLCFAELTVVDCPVCVSMFVLCSSNPLFIVVFRIKRKHGSNGKWQNYVIHLNEQS